MQRLVVIASVSLVAFIGPARAGGSAPDTAGPRYRYVELANPAGSSASEAIGINDSHDVVGVSTYQNAGRATLWSSSGEPTDLASAVGGAFGQSIGRSITSAGVVWGNSDFDSSKPGSGAFNKNGKWHSIGTGYANATSFSGVFGANGNGFAVGQRAPSVPPPQFFERFKPQAFTWHNGMFTTITLGGKNGEAFAINRDNVVVGYSETAPTKGGGGRIPHAFRWQDSVITDLGTIGVNAAQQSQARSINSVGDVVGFGLLPGQNAFHAVEWKASGSVIDLGLIGGSLDNSDSEATGVNDAGEIVGDSTTDSGVTHAFIVTGGKMFDLNRITSGIPTHIALSFANAIADDGTIVGTTCAPPSTCPRGAPSGERAFMLLPVSQ